MEIIITPAELAQAKMSDAHLAQAVEAIREDGFVVLADVIDFLPSDLDHNVQFTDKPLEYLLTRTPIIKA